MTTLADVLPPFAVVMGVALLLTGLGFIVLVAGLLVPGGLRRRRSSTGSAPRVTPAVA